MLRVAFVSSGDEHRHRKEKKLARMDMCVVFVCDAYLNEQLEGNG